MNEEERSDRDERQEFEGDIPAEREASLLNLRTLLISVAGLVGMILFIHLFAGGLFAYYRSTEPPDFVARPPTALTQPPAEPGLQIDPAEDLLRVRATEQSRLQGYGWIDRDAGLIHIPIERAIEIVAERGLPVIDERPLIRERIDAKESGFPHPSEIPVGTPGPQGTPLLEITVPADILESLTPEPDVTETNPTEGSTEEPDARGTPGGFGSLAFVSHGTGGQTNQVDPIDDVGYDQKLNNQLPMDTVLFDEGGHLVKIGDFFNEKPIVLVFAYYECPMLCTLVLNELTRAMRSIDLDIGNQFEVITVSIDPRETFELAVAKKETYLNQYNRPGAEKGWHFLTGKAAAIQDLTKAVGFRYFYDAELDQFAHPAGILVLTPDGRIARYLSALDLPAKDLKLGLVEASAGRIGTAVDQFFLLCYAYDPVSGRYNLVIENVLLISSLLTTLLLGSMISIFIWKERRKGSHYLGPTK